VRTTTAVPQGRAGLSYPALPPQAPAGSIVLSGLRQNDADRSNVALQNAGSASDGPVVLRVTVFNGDPQNPLAKLLPDVMLPPGGFTQLSGVLASNGLALSNGWVKVERVGGTAPYYAYAVINDQRSSDGSLVTPVLISSGTAVSGLTLPAVVEAGAFTSELTLTNRSGSARTLTLTYVAAAVGGGSTSLELTLKSGEQKIIPSFVEYLRGHGAPGVGPKGPAFAGALFATVDYGDMNGVFLGVRTAATSEGGSYGVFYPAVPYGAASTREAWVYALRQDAENRSNLALVNTGETDGGDDVFTIELYDGAEQRLAAKIEGIRLGAGAFTQIGAVLAQYAPGVAQGFARVVRTSGENPFIVYGAVNDGGKPGERTGDGAFLASTP
jgi:hypothetical protein